MQNSLSVFGLRVNKVGTLDNDLKQGSRDSSPKMPKLLKELKKTN